MQRWIALAVVGLVLLLGGGAWGFRAYKNSRPYPVWVPLPLNDSQPEDSRKAFAKQLEAELRKPALLSTVVKELGLAAKFKVASDEAAVAELNKRIFVRLSSGTNSMGARVPQLDVGVDGIRSEEPVVRAIVSRLMAEIDRIFNVAGRAPKI